MPPEKMVTLNGEDAVSPTDEPSKMKMADEIAIILLGTELFHDSDGNAYATISVDGHKETWNLRSKAAKSWVLHQFYLKEKTSPNPEALTTGLAVAEAHARFDGEEHPVHVRVAAREGKIYLDLADSQWRAVEVDEDGWRVVENVPVKFRRPSGLLPLPLPVSGGSIDDLASLLNAKKDDMPLLAAWLVAALRSSGPYPVLALNGEQGTGKSNAEKILRYLVDPHTVPLRALPREERDLFVAAINSHVIAFDNVSRIPWWLSDALCRISTGGGWAARALYTDSDEVLLDVVKPITMNGIEQMVDRPDLGERSIILNLEPIDEDRRRTEAEVWREVERRRPKILGLLLDAVSTGLRNIDTVRLDRKPRLADFASWAVATEPAFPWPIGTFMTVYEANQANTAREVLEADLVAEAILSLMDGQKRLTGTATELYSTLCGQEGDTVTKKKEWPGAPNVLSSKLTRAMSSLRKVDITIDRDREGHARNRIITIRRMPAVNRNTSSAPSSRSRAITDQARSADDDADDTGDADDKDIVRTENIVRNKPLKIHEKDDTDGADGLSSGHTDPDCLQCGKSIDDDPKAVQATTGGVDGRIHGACYWAFVGLELPAFLDRRNP